MYKNDEHDPIFCKGHHRGIQVVSLEVSSSLQERQSNTRYAKEGDRSWPPGQRVRRVRDAHSQVHHGHSRHRMSKPATVTKILGFARLESKTGVWPSDILGPVKGSQRV